MNDLKNFYKKHVFLFWGGGISIILFLFFLLLHYYQSDVLKLETKWLIISGIPILIALIGGGYIKSFKGFGIELEAQLRNPLKQFDLFAKDAIKDLPQEAKETESYLNSFDTDTVLNVQRLTFYINKKNYYNSYVIEKYIRKLPNLKFFEIADEDNKFIGLLPIRIFRKVEYYDLNTYEEETDINHTNLDKLVNAINQGNILESFANTIITEVVNEHETLIDILPKAKNSRHGILAVISNKSRLLGIIDKKSIESKIAEEVLKARVRS